MPSTAREVFSLLALLAVAGAIPTVFAHGGDGGAMEMGDDGDTSGHGGMGSEASKPDPDSYPATYFAHPEHVSLIYAHIGIMVIGWVFMLPTGTRHSRLLFGNQDPDRLLIKGL